MPTKLMCAACTNHACDWTAILLKRCLPSADFAQSLAEPLPGRFCRPAAWQQVAHGLRTRGPEYIGGEVRQGAVDPLTEERVESESLCC